MNNVEMLPVVTDQGIVTGKATRTECHSGSMILHPVVHIHLLKGNMIYLQKRAYTKDIQPGKWDTAVGGHIQYGHEPVESALREAEEELGISEGLNLELIMTYVWKSGREHEFIYCYKSNYNGLVSIDYNEVIDGRFWTQKEIEENIDSDIFTPNFSDEYKKIRRKLFPV